MGSIRNPLGSTGTFCTNVPIVVCDGFKMFQIERINCLNVKNEGSDSNRGQDPNNGTALLILTHFGGRIIQYSMILSMLGEYIKS